MVAALVNRLDTFLDFNDILFKDFFHTDSFFDSIFRQPKYNYPIDIKEDKHGIQIDIATVGIDKKDISIETKNNILKISYKKENIEDDDFIYIHKGIAKRSFNFGWKILNKDLDLENIKASINKGLLIVRIPLNKKPEVDNNYFKKVEIK